MPSQVNITLIPGRSFAWQDAKYWQDATSRAAIMARFWSFVKRAKAKDCWLWTGPTNSRGYGLLTVHGHTRARAHRFAWLISRGPIPKGSVVCHNCDCSLCVNPDHLRLDSQAGNIHESVRKARKNCWGHQKLDAERVSELRHRYAAGGVTQKELAKDYGIARNTVSQIVGRKTWAHLADVPATMRQVS